MSESEFEESIKHCIKTEVVIPAGVILPWILARFPELARDARLMDVSSNFRGGFKFIVEHTVQPVKNVGPILLSPVGNDEEDLDL